MNKYQAIFSLPVGKLGVQTRNNKLVGLSFLDNKTPDIAPENDLAKKVIKQIRLYLKDPGWEFDLPCESDGTTHQNAVWAQLKKLKPGETITYGEMADALESGARAVGNACRSNPLPIIVPCHRVIAKNDIGGFDGDRKNGKVSIKSWLLKHEGLEI